MAFFIVTKLVAFQACIRYLSHIGLSISEVTKQIMKKNQDFFLHNETYGLWLYNDGATPITKQLQIRSISTAL